MVPSKKNMLLASSSFTASWAKDFFSQAVSNHKPILFVPYARPSGMSEEAYFKIAQDRLGEIGVSTICAPPAGITEKDLQNIGGIFVGGGHTYTLLHKLQQNGALDLIRQKVEEGLPYMGSSAGTNIACPTIKTTNDMPCPAHDVIDLKALGLIGIQLNCHYIDDSMHDPKHQGETRDTRLKEFCAFNPDTPVLGLYEGQALRIEGDKAQLLTSESCRGTKSPVFTNNKREEIECEIGVPKDVSRIFRAQKSPVQEKHRAPRVQ